MISGTMFPRDPDTMTQLAESEDDDQPIVDERSLEDPRARRMVPPQKNFDTNR
jgi:hypothetical protein